MMQKAPSHLFPSTGTTVMRQPDYAPSKFIDWLIKLFKVRNDSQLAEKLYIDRIQICRIRHGQIAISAFFILRIHELTGVPVAEIKQKYRA
jgi:hypothetical protein